MTQELLFARFPELQSLPEEKKRQVYAHFRTAPDWLLEELTVVQLPADTIFIREGQQAGDIFVVASGTVKAIEYRVFGFQYDFIQFTKVYALGGMEVLMDLELYRTTLKTMESCIALRLSRAAFERWLTGDPQALRYEAKLMGEYLLEQGRLAREYMFLPGPERLAKLLVQRYDSGAADGILVLRTSRQELSNETGFGIKTVNRAVKSLADGGYITKLDRSIQITRDQYESLKRLISMIIAPEAEG